MNKRPGTVTFILWGALVGISLFQSLHIIDAWKHDPSNRLGEYVFAIWLAALCLHLRPLPSPWPIAQVAQLCCGGVLLVLGIVGEMQALIYFAFVLLLTLPVPQLMVRLSIGLCSFFWMPAWTWIATPLLGASITYISIALVGCFALASLIHFKLNHGTKTNPSLT